MDNNTNTNENTTVTQNKSGCGFFKKFLLFVLAVIAILKVIEKIKKKSFERFNSKGRVRKYISIFSNKKIDNSEKLDGVCIYSLFSNVSIVSFFSNISVRVPEGLKVNIDGLCCKSVVNGNVAETDDEEGGMYVAYNANFSRIRIDN